jgi:hypothetical protein
MTKNYLVGMQMVLLTLIVIWRGINGALGSVYENFSMKCKQSLIDERLQPVTIVADFVSIPFDIAP